MHWNLRPLHSRAQTKELLMGWEFIHTLVCSNLLYIWALNVSSWIFCLAFNGVDGLHVGLLCLALDQNPHGGTLGIVEISCSPFLVLKPMDIAAIFGLSWMFLYLISCPLRYLTLSKSTLHLLKLFSLVQALDESLATPSIELLKIASLSC